MEYRLNKEIIIVHDGHQCSTRCQFIVHNDPEQPHRHWCTLFERICWNRLIPGVCFSFCEKNKTPKKTLDLFDQ